MTEFLRSLLPQDKWAHLIVGATIVLVTFWPPVLLGLVVTIPAKVGLAWTAYLVARATAFCKEAFDEGRPDRHTKDILDAEVTVSGACYATAANVIYLIVIFQ